ncbi:MAG: hypothetical protein WCZ68_06285, partial [Sedimentibacter sp.]
PSILISFIIAPYFHDLILSYAILTYYYNVEKIIFNDEILQSYSPIYLLLTSYKLGTRCE